MEVVTTVVAFVAMLFVLVLVHELGHFISPKRAGITVQEFGIGFPPRIASVVWRGTRYSLNWIPLGGFVKMLGEDGDLELQRMRKEGREPAEIEAAVAGAFNRKPIWVRIVVLGAGVVMNLVLAVALFSVVVTITPQIHEVPPLIDDVAPGSPAAAAGLRSGDAVLAADATPVEDSGEFSIYVRDRAGEPVVLTVRRGERTLVVEVVPRRPEEIPAGQGAIGLSWRTIPDPNFQPPAPLEAVAQGAALTWTVASQIPPAIGQGIGGLLGLVDDPPDIAGPIGIARQTGEVLQLPLAAQLFWVALLSTNLAVLNILPFPPLDGSRILVTIIEAVRRRRLAAEREALIYATGFMVLLALIILVSINDISRP